jgi:hypothetical protein
MCLECAMDLRAGLMMENILSLWDSAFRARTHETAGDVS